MWFALVSLMKATGLLCIEVKCFVINSRLSFSAGYYTILSQQAIIQFFHSYFLQFKEFELYWGAVFLRFVHTFSWFLKSNCSSDFGHAETGSEPKKRVVLRCDFFHFNFKVEWKNGVRTKIRFLASNFLFTCVNFTLIFAGFFSIFWIGFFFLMLFPIQS